MPSAILLSAVLCFALSVSTVAVEERVATEQSMTLERPENVTTHMAEMFEEETSTKTISRMMRDTTQNNYWSTWRQFGSRSFLFVNREMSWAAAEKYCMAYKAHLTSIHSPAEYTFIQQIVRSQTYTNTRAWIGGTDGSETWQWFWSDGSNFVYHDWASGEPNNLFGVERCIEINSFGENRWNDRGCWDRLPFICGSRPDGPC